MKKSFRKIALSVSICAAALIMSPLKGADTSKELLFKYNFNQTSNELKDLTGHLPEPEFCGPVSIENTKEGKTVKLDGKKAYLVLPKTENIHLANGGTFCTVVKFDEIGNTGGTPEAHDMIFFKDKEFLLGKDAEGKLYFNMHDGNTWATPSQGGKVEAGAWTHIAAVIERLNDVAQGEVGYKVTLYKNGENVFSKKFLNIKPAENDNLIDIGKGWGGPWFFKGELSELSMYKRALTEGEIEELVAGAQNIKLSKKDYFINGDLKKSLEELSDLASGNSAKWAITCLTKSVKLGFDQAAMQETVAKIKPALTALKDDNTFTEQWNSLKTPFQAINTGKIQVMLVKDVPLMSPLLGIRASKQGTELMGALPLSMAITYSANGSKLTEFDTAEKCISGKVISIIQKNNESNALIEWTHKSDDKHPLDFKAFTTLKITGERIETDFKLENNSQDLIVSEVTFPRFSFAELKSGESKLVYPHMSGILDKNPVENKIKREGFYPSGRVCMQFAAYYDNAIGIYCAFEDPLARTKFISVSGKKNTLEISWKSYIGIPLECKGGNSFQINGKGAVEFFEGDWFDAGQIYKKWLAKEAKWWIKDLPRKDSPEWFRNLPLWVLCSSPNSQTDMEMIKSAENLRQYIGLPFGIHWYLWDDTKKADWPHFYPRDTVQETTKTLKEKGIYVKPYIDSRLWNVLDGKMKKEDWMFSSHGKSYAVKNRDGSMTFEVYDKDKYATMCPASDGWRKWMTDLTERVADYGFNAIYHDQVATAKPIMCFDKSHGHSLGGGEVWLEQGYWPMYKEIRERLKGKHSAVAHDTEENAEPYLQAFDGFMTWRWTDENHIPLFQSIYAGRVQFTGKLFDHQKSGNSESFFVKCAEQLVCAEQIGWFLLSDMNFPGKKKLYVKKMSHIRNMLLDWFNAADMQHPLKFKGEMPEVSTKWGAIVPAMITTPKIQHSVWKHGDDIMIVFVNSVNEKVSVDAEINLEKYGFKSKSAELGICRESTENPEVKSISSQSIQKLELSPLKSEVWFISQKKTDAFEKNIAKTAETMKKIAAFDEGPFALTFKETSAKPAYNWFNPEDAIQLVGASIKKGNEYIGWITSNCVIYYGVVDFGNGSKKLSLEAELAVDPSNTGGNIEFILDNPFNGKTIAKYTSLNSTGGYNQFAVLETPVIEQVSGKHKLFIRIEDAGSCNIKKWRFQEK